MPSPPQSRWAKWILPPPSCGQPVGRQGGAHEEDRGDGRDEEELKVAAGIDAAQEERSVRGSCRVRHRHVSSRLGPAHQVGHSRIP